MKYRPAVPPPSGGTPRRSARRRVADPARGAGRSAALFAETLRVLRPGGVFAASDGLDGRLFRLMHLGDTCVPVPPETAADRMLRIGFTDVEIDTGASSFRFRARRPE
ncbi:hypothetical protein [Nocardia abscessus]|uniref:hypothetical protein n=1 Tax=Nocardia abscessus TaxID=120957 RepID=UPI001E6072A0|nr:hypothetical protein [Nocardia abscessus]